eukprot:scaffold52862_cov30-Tisochrysis_lutea.AAC.2
MMKPTNKRAKRRESTICQRKPLNGISQKVKKLHKIKIQKQTKRPGPIMDQSKRDCNVKAVSARNIPSVSAAATMT